MKYDEYSEWTDVTALYPRIHEPHYLALGLAEEVAEWMLAYHIEDTLAEAGDVFWYGARYAKNVLHTPLSEIMKSRKASLPTENLQLGVCAGIIAGVEKKRLRDGALWTDEKRVAKEAEAARALTLILQHVQENCEGLGYSIEQVLDMNVQKLSKRKAHDTIQGDGDHR